MDTSTEQHLWILWTTKSPYVRPRPYRNQESTRPHQNNFSLEIQGDAEQVEPGRTKRHTFRFVWPFGSSRLFFYSINLGDSKIKATRSPIFVYDINHEVLLAETWPYNDIPALSWEASPLPPLPQPHYTTGQVQLHGVPNGGASITLKVWEYLGQDPSILCDMYVRVAFQQWYPIHPAVELEASVHLIFANAAGDTSARVAYFSVFQDPCTYNPTNYVIPAAPGATIGMPPFNMQMTAISLCAQPNDPPISDPYLAEIRLLAAEANNVFPPEVWTYTFGTIEIGTTRGKLTDVSGQWRGKRLSPFLP